MESSGIYDRARGYPRFEWIRTGGVEIRLAASKAAESLSGYRYA